MSPDASAGPLAGDPLHQLLARLDAPTSTYSLTRTLRHDAALLRETPKTPANGCPSLPLRIRLFNTVIAASPGDARRTS